MSDNPFSLAFGKEPLSIINRYQQENDIIEDFNSTNPSSQVYMITGVRGVGKTVTMTSIASKLRDMKEWVVADLVANDDLLKTLAATLSNEKSLLQIFKDAKINLSVLGLGLEIDGEPPITDINVALDRMIERLTKQKRKLLITVDEVTNTEYVRIFVSYFQVFVRKRYNVFLLMTGLYENIYDLQNDKNLTFLYRAPKVELRPLNLVRITKSYGKLLGYNEEECKQMASLTKGYSFAYQLLGYLCFKYSAKAKDVIDEFDEMLADYIYTKIWDEMSDRDREILTSMAAMGEETFKVEVIRDSLEMSSNNFTQYRNRLIKKGVLISPKYGYLEFTLPRFDKFALAMEI